MRFDSVLINNTVTVCMHLRANRVSFPMAFRTCAADTAFPGRRLAELIVELNSLLNSEDVRFFENSM